MSGVKSSQVPTTDQNYERSKDEKSPVTQIWNFCIFSILLGPAHVRLLQVTEAYSRFDRIREMHNTRLASEEQTNKS
jgi:hypothetical protein